MSFAAVSRRLTPYLPDLSLVPHRLAQPAQRAEALRGLLLALRGAVVFMVPFLAGLALGSPQDAVFAAFSAHSIALVDVEGPYVLRLNLLCLLAVAFAASAACGTLAAGSLAGAVAVTGVLGLSVGLWRQVCRDYGPGAAVPCALVLFTALGMAPLGTPLAALAPAAATHALATFAGGLFGVACLLAYWPLRPQYPLRRLVGRNWVGVASLARAVARGLRGGDAAGDAAAAGLERALRATLDAAYDQIAPLAGPGAHPFWNNLSATNLTAARFAARLTALRALGVCPAASAGDDLPAALDLLAKAANTVAHVVVRPRPGSMRIAVRAMHAAREALERAAARGDAADGRLAALVAETAGRFAETEKALRQISRPRAGRAAFREQRRRIARWIGRPLGGTFSFRRRLDPALVRYSLGLSLLLMAAAAAFKALGLPHGSWLPFSMLVVLQPSAGLTRARMAHRVAGTVAGALVAGLPLWRTLPLPGLLAVIAVCCAIFTYLMRRHYGTAVFFITVTVVLMTSLDTTLPWHLAVERLGCVVAGSLAAWGVAGRLWSAPSEARIRGLLAASFTASGDYLRTVRNALATGGDHFHHESVAAKRRAERANAALAAAVAQWRGAPAPDDVASLAAFAPRLTAMLTVLFLQQETDPRPVDDPEADSLARQVEAVLAGLAAGCAGPEGFVNGTGGAGGVSPGIPPVARGAASGVVRQLRDIRSALCRAGRALMPA